jgi:hypothetical protein
VDFVSQMIGGVAFATLTPPCFAFRFDTLVEVSAPRPLLLAQVASYGYRDMVNECGPTTDYPRGLCAGVAAVLRHAFPRATIIPGTMDLVLLTQYF